MTRRFVVLTDSLTGEEEKNFTAALGPDTAVAWWHWLPNSWLVVDPNDTLTADEISGRFTAINTTARALVIEVDHKFWAGRFRMGEPDSKMWLEDWWEGKKLGLEPGTY